MRPGKIVFLSFLVLLGLFIIGSGLDLAFGWFNVYKTKTVGKAQQDAERTVFEETQSFVHGKRQEALKLYKEWNEAETTTEKKAIEEYAAMNFAYFNEDKHLEGKIQLWVAKCKYGDPQQPFTITPTE